MSMNGTAHLGRSVWPARPFAGWAARQPSRISIGADPALVLAFSHARLALAFVAKDWPDVLIFSPLPAISCQNHLPALFFSTLYFAIFSLDMIVPFLLGGHRIGCRRPRSGFSGGALVTLRGNLAHRVLGERRDRETRVHAEVRRDGRAVTDEQPLVAEDLPAAVDDAVLAVSADHRAAEDVGADGDPEARLEDRRLRRAADLAGEPSREIVGGGDRLRLWLVRIRGGRQQHSPTREAARGLQRQ